MITGTISLRQELRCFTSCERHKHSCTLFSPKSSDLLCALQVASRLALRWNLRINNHREILFSSLEIGPFLEASANAAAAMHLRELNYALLAVQTLLSGLDITRCLCHRSVQLD